MTSLADSGPNILRQTIEDANGLAGADTVTFGVTGTITLASTLQITELVTVNGIIDWGQSNNILSAELIKPSAI